MCYCVYRLLFVPTHNYEIRPEAVFVKHYNAAVGTQISKSGAVPRDSVTFFVASTAPADGCLHLLCLVWQ